MKQRVVTNRKPRTVIHHPPPGCTPCWHGGVRGRGLALVYVVADEPARLTSLLSAESLPAGMLYEAGLAWNRLYRSARRVLPKVLLFLSHCPGFAE